MSKVINTMKLIETAMQCADDRYTICVNNIMDIERASAGKWDLISNSFYFGYMQGVKAAKAEMRKTV